MTGSTGTWTRYGRRLALAAVAAAGLAASALAQGRPAPVEVAMVERGRFTETVPVLGRLVAPTHARIATRIAGIVDSVFVDVGDRVAAGDPIARLDDELLHLEQASAEASLAQARAAIRVATANLEMARQAFARMESLKSSVAFSRARFEDLLKESEAALGSVAEAEARRASAETALARARYNIRNTEIRAAVGGVVIAREVEPGAYLQLGQPVVTLLNDTQLEIEADIPTEIIASVVPGLTVEVTLDDGTAQSARVRALIPSEAPSTRTRPVRFEPVFSGLKKPLAAGQSATLHIPFGAGRTVLTVPKDALVQATSGWIVYAAEDGKAQPRQVSIGAAVDDRFEVLSGLEEGTVVVVRGNERLRPGQPISFAAADQQPAAPPGEAAGSGPAAGG